MNETNRLYLAMRVYSDNAQRTSERGKNISHATRLRLVAYFLPRFDVSCAFSEYTRMDK